MRNTTPAHPQPTDRSRPLSGRQLVALATVVFVAALLSLVVACRGLGVESASSTSEFQVISEAAISAPLGYVPAAFGSPLDPTATPTATPAPTPQIGPPLPAPTVVVAMPPIDFEAAREEAQAKGLDLAFVKIGFHTGAGGNTQGIGDYFRKLNDAGVPIFLKSVDDPGKLIELQGIMKENEANGREVPHILVYRLTDSRFEAPYYDLSLSPEEAAAVSWELHRSNWSSQLDKKYVWFETHNEPGRYGYDGKLQIERLGRFSLATAKLAVAQGYRYAALGWSTGVPEAEDWEDPAMLAFLRYAADHPDQVAVALHEYSLESEYIGNGYPYLVGRFQALFEACDKHGIPRPTVLITEWGWTHDTVPEPVQAIEDIAWASWLYAAYPTVKGAAIWYLGRGDNGIHNQTQQLIAPLADYAVSHYFLYTPGIGQIDAEIFRPNPPTLLGLDWWREEPTPAPQPRTP